MNIHTKSQPFAKRLKAGLRRAFSLVELLVVIAVIGVIAAIAIPNIGSITGSATTAKAKRNAQSIASVAASALAAGYVPATAWADEAAAVDDLQDGASPTTGAFAGTLFKVDVADAEEAAAIAHLTLNADGHLEYTPTP